MSLTLRIKIRKIFFVLFIIFLLFSGVKSSKINLNQFKNSITLSHQDKSPIVPLDSSINLKENNITDVSFKNDISISSIIGCFEFKKSPSFSDIEKWNTENSFSLKIFYEAVFTINIEDICVDIDKNGILNIQYDLTNINLKSIDIKNFSYSETDLLAKKCSVNEIFEIIDESKIEIKKEIESNLSYKMNAAKDFEKKTSSFVKSLDLFGVRYNKTELQQFKAYYSYKDMSNVNHGYNPNQKVQQIEYIVIHSTDNPDVSALEHIHWLNTSKKDAKAVHYYIDNKNVIKALDESIQAWGVGDAKIKTDIKNSNSIQIEICELKNSDEQDMAINNAIMFIKDVILKQYPSAKIVTHHDASRKYCPRIILNQQDGWKLFLDKIYN